VHVARLLIGERVSAGGMDLVGLSAHDVTAFMARVCEKGKPNRSRRQVERAPAFGKLVKWRTGCEGRISCLKRGYGWSRTLADGLVGAKIWCGWGVLAHNLDRIGVLRR
jgi:transposase, IS5 family